MEHTVPEQLLEDHEKDHKDGHEEACPAEHLQGAPGFPGIGSGQGHKAAGDEHGENIGYGVRIVPGIGAEEVQQDHQGKRQIGKPKEHDPGSAIQHKPPHQMDQQHQTEEAEADQHPDPQIPVDEEASGEDRQNQHQPVRKTEILPDFL